MKKVITTSNKADAYTIQELEDLMFLLVYTDTFFILV